MTCIFSFSRGLAALTLACLFLVQPALSQPADPPALRGRDDASLIGALTEFAYERGALYSVEASPQRITDIALEPGETLLSISAGDTARWIVGDARSGAGPSGQAHVLVKPNAAKLSTNLVIMTDRRVYHVELTSTAGPAMAAIAWRYPVEMTLTGTAATPAPEPAPALPPKPEPARPEPAFSPQALNLRYRIEGDRPDWRPLSAFDDGQRVFIEMPARIGVMEAPPLFVIGDDGPELVNYRVQANFYVVDRLFAKAELRLGSGWSQKTVRIVRQTPIAGANGEGEVHG